MYKKIIIEKPTPVQVYNPQSTPRSKVPKQQAKEKDLLIFICLLSPTLFPSLRPTTHPCPTTPSFHFTKRRPTFTPTTFTTVSWFYCTTSTWFFTICIVAT